mmetsp:Transcript_83067/g.268751  ORF Transcript_83067/g.268751 Transcript_83067/m.268751 type:complete len:334 (-) Transcript_83067:1435-2436(-)
MRRNLRHTNHCCYCVHRSNHRCWSPRRRRSHAPPGRACLRPRSGRHVRCDRRLRPSYRCLPSLQPKGSCPSSLHKSPKWLGLHCGRTHRAHLHPLLFGLAHIQNCFPCSLQHHCTNHPPYKGLHPNQRNRHQGANCCPNCCPWHRPCQGRRSHLQHCCPKHNPCIHCPHRTARLPCPNGFRPDQPHFDCHQCHHSSGRCHGHPRLHRAGHLCHAGLGRHICCGVHGCHADHGCRPGGHDLAHAGHPCPCPASCPHHVADSGPLRGDRCEIGRRTCHRGCGCARAGQHRGRALRDGNRAPCGCCRRMCHGSPASCRPVQLGSQSCLQPAILSQQ